MAKLTSDDSEFPLTLEEASWVASIVNLGRIFGAIVGGFFAYYYGCKMSLFLTSITMSLGWIFIGFSTTVIWLCIARSICGFGVGMAFSSFPLYLGEISNQKIRGSLVTIAMSGLSIGAIVASAICTIFNLKISSAIFLVPCVIVIILFAYLPESPHHLIHIKDEKKAKLSLAWYNRYSNIDENYMILEKFVESSNSQSFYEKLATFKKTEIKKALFIVLMLFFYQQTCGLNTIVFYMELILKEAQVKIVKPSDIVIIASICALLASWISMYLIERLGRRLLMITSSFLTAISLTLLSCHFLLIDNGYDPSKLQLLPISAILLFNISIFGGVGVVPSTVLSEIFPSEIKFLAATGASISSAFFAFICSKTFQPLIDVLGHQYVYFIYAGFILSAIPFVFFLMPETKGRSLEEIQQDIARKK